MDSKVIDLATTLRATYGIRTPDAIQVASCLSQQGEHLFLTNDKQLEKIPELNVALF